MFYAEIIFKSICKNTFFNAYTEGVLFFGSFLIFLRAAHRIFGVTQSSRRTRSIFFKKKLCVLRELCVKQKTVCQNAFKTNDFEGASPQNDRKQLGFILSFEHIFTQIFHFLQPDFFRNPASFPPFSRMLPSFKTVRRFIFRNNKIDLNNKFLFHKLLTIKQLPFEI
jgi:hypothetical protein